jgi:hypothetical protein
MASSRPDAEASDRGGCTPRVVVARLSIDMVVMAVVLAPVHPDIAIERVRWKSRCGQSTVCRYW